MSTFVKVIIKILLITANSGQLYASFNVRVIGGQSSQPGQFPFMASLSHFDADICGASIISKNWVLTAAHCLQGVTCLSDLKVIVGRTVRSFGGIEHNVAKIVVHPKFNNVTFTSDIALIKVTPSFQFNSLIQRIKIGIASINQNCTLLGWGIYSLKDQLYSDELQFVNLRVSSFQDDKICIYSREKGFCYGDSGGPLIANNELIGIVSNGIPCVRGFPDLYTSVYLYKKWIILVILEREY